jgi:tight adherence protein B
MVLLLVAFAISFLTSVALVLFVSAPANQQRAVQERLVVLQNTTYEAPENERLHLADKEPRRKFSGRITERFKSYHFAENLELLIMYSGSKQSVGSIIMMSVGVAAVAGFIVNWFDGPAFLVAGISLLGTSFPYFFLRFKKGSRLKKFEAALPDAIDLMARALRAGHSVASSIEIISEQTPQPLSAEFALCFQQQKFGIPFRDAITAMGQRVPSQDLHFLITAVLVQKETGGDLTEILDRTTHVIRERGRIQGEIRTYTAQGRLTGWILSALPVGMLGLTNIITPGYSSVLFHDPLGQMLLGAGAVFILLGAFIISKIVDIKV